jgi:hypothetical protein
MLDPEAESAALKERSHQLIELLDDAHPVLDRSELDEVLAESRRLGDAARRARREAATKFVTDGDAGVPVGPAPVVRRVQTNRHGRDRDVFHGRSVVTDQLLEYWRHRKDVVFPATERMHRAAVEDRPYNQALVSAAHGHVSVLQGRRSVLSEAGDLLEAALKAYDDSYANVRMAALDSQQIANEAQTRLDSLKREAASALVGGDEVKGFIANTLGVVLDAPVDPDTAMPLIQVDKTGQPV